MQRGEGEDYCECKRSYSISAMAEKNVEEEDYCECKRSSKTLTGFLAHLLHSNELQHIKRVPRMNPGTLSIYCNSQ